MMKPRVAGRAGVAAFLFALVPAVAYAHTGSGAGAGFAHGFAHPLLGADHLLAMIAVGLWAAQSRGRAAWAMPAAFVGFMVAGFALGLGGVAVPAVELGIALSVLVLGAVVAAAIRVPLAAAACVVGVFALFHGHAHGAEIPAGVLAATYGAGFAVATALLHATGVALVIAARGALASSHAAVTRTAGAAIAVAGMMLWLV